jgi:predicted TIM-barrel fold metal-dependent hydrolase
VQPSLPPRYRKLAAPLGIVGAIKIEASPWVEDNLWVLDTIQPTPFFVGHVGNLQPEKPEFGAYLERFAKNPLFRGIRYGNLGS